MTQAIAETSQEIARLDEEEARRDAWRRRQRALLARSDALLGRVERAKLKDATRISEELRLAIVELALEVGQEICGPLGPQKAVDRLYDVQDELLCRLHPEYADDNRCAGALWSDKGRSEEPEPDDPEQATRAEVWRLLTEAAPQGFAWSDLVRLRGRRQAGEERRALIACVLEAMEAEGILRRVPSGRQGGGWRYLPAGRPG